MKINKKHILSSLVLGATFLSFTSVSANSWNFQAGVKVMGNTNINISNSYKLSMRKVIKENTEKLIKGMKSGNVVNRVKYLSGVNLDLSNDSDLSKYDTIVLKNGNVIISKDLKISGKIMQITSLRTDNSKTNLGNVYVTPEVKTINASIYADGGLISIKDISDLTALKTYDIQRKRILDNQLVIKGSLFTRNTLGGAISKSGKYKLPEGSLTTDFDFAMYQDLYWTRISKRQSNCENLPANASWNSASNILQRSWDRIDWFPKLTGEYNTTTSSDTCVFVCNTGYSYKSSTNTCEKNYWSYSNRGACNVSCGVGSQTRSASCTKWDGSSASHCIDTPNNTMSCDMGSCSILTYVHKHYRGPYWGEWRLYNGDTYELYRVGGINPCRVIYLSYSALKSNREGRAYSDCTEGPSGTMSCYDQNMQAITCP